MTQQDKDLLLRDLSARLTYGVRGKVKADTVVPHRYDIDGFPLETTFDVDVELQRIDVSTGEIFVSTFDNDEALGTYIEESQTEGEPWTIEEFKPYLRPMSSMTEEERTEYNKFNDFGSANLRRYEYKDFILYIPSYERIDWLNKHHFDYRGLIPKGLALEAPKDMYK